MSVVEPSAAPRTVVRDPLADHLLTPLNSALILIDVDAVGGTSAEAHRAALERIVQAGAHPITWVSLAGELQRDWARQETVAGIVDVVLNERLLKE